MAAQVPAERVASADRTFDALDPQRSAGTTIGDDGFWRVGRPLWTSQGVHRIFTANGGGACTRLAFHWESLLLYPVLFWSAMFALGLGSGCTAGFGALLAELFPTEVRNVLMGTAYNCARGVQFFAPILVSAVVANYGFAGGLSVPLVLALATAAWVWTLPETRQRDLAQIGQEAAID